MNTDLVVWISPFSPLLTYSGGWQQAASGTAQCGGTGDFAVQVDQLYFTEFIWYWQSSSGYTVSAGLDGSLQTGTAGAQAATLSISAGDHSARLQVECDDCGSTTFTLSGAELTSTGAGSWSNSTLDDASSAVTYTGWTSTSSASSSIGAISSGTFYQGTVSYTSSAGASAAFSFTGSALYVFGCTGPSFVSFQITLDSSVVGTFNASTTTDSYDTLLFFVSGLNEASHSVSITNQVDGDSSGITAGTSTGTATGTAATAVFSGSSGTWSEGGGTGSAGAVAGGILGALGGLLLLYFAYRYYLYRKAGGEGGFFTALCGPPRKPPQKAGPAKDEFKIWPMVRSRPKYMT
ncbi:hypothetical protein EHS25_001201 [Saitozyma podzolica]|uniref:Uncharacterized protein n=1 Tax=Saitozyma podzolica TaxID=1890683 RepID=A0A427YHH7_9TREE|nr:hypothetical protein EHS25_001201 [Saitozyma podzolica]